MQLLLIIPNELSREGEETTLANDQVEVVIRQIDVHIFGGPNNIKSSEPTTKAVRHWAQRSAGTDFFDAAARSYACAATIAVSSGLVPSSFRADWYMWSDGL